MLSFTTPDKVSAVPGTDKVLAAPKLTAPAKLLLPVDTLSMPPFSVKASAPTVTPFKSSTVPLATVTPPALAPKPLLWVTSSVPLFSVTLPVKVLLPDKVNTLLAVSFCRRPAPLMTPLRTWSTLLLSTNAAPEAMAMSAA